MDIFRCFRQKLLLLRCIDCNYSAEITPKQVRMIIKVNGKNPWCPIIHPCPKCSGFLIPFLYTDKNRAYRFAEIKSILNEAQFSPLAEKYVFWECNIEFP